MLELLAAAWWPALLAGTVAVLVTVAIERYGGVVGGLLGTLPTTIVPASLGMWGGDTVDFADAMGAVPAGMLINALFLWLWRVVPGRLPQGLALGPRLALMSLVSLSAWASLATLLVIGLGAADALGLTAFPIGVATLLLLVGLGLAATRTPRPAPRGRRRAGPAVLAARGALAGLAIGVAVIVHHTGGPVAGGVASVFPAIFITAMVSLWLSQGEAVPAGAVGPMMLGSAAVGAYALLAALLFPVLGVAWGALVAWGLALLTTTLPAAWWLIGRSGARSHAT